jgi:hypothetical protein
MHVLAGADDGVDRARLDALGATDAVGFDNHGDLRWLVFATRAVEWFRSDAKYVRQRMCAGVATWGAAVDAGHPCGQGFGVGATAGIAALAALRLRQDSVEAFDEAGCCHAQGEERYFTGAPGCAPLSTSSKCRPLPSKPADRIMPSLTPKRILRGARLAMNTTLRPTNFPGSP